jgi:ribonuclease BN (tRNA processing enzyme)
MRLTVLGSGSCELIAERSSSSYLLEAGGATILLDAGQGALRRLLDSGREPSELDGVVLSHLHLDHIADLIPLFFALSYDPELSARARFTLVADPRAGDLLSGLAGAVGTTLDVEPPSVTRQWLAPGEACDIGPVAIRAARASHTEASLAYRFEHGGSSLVYLGDSEASPALVDLARGADLLIAHCAAPDSAPKPGHLHPSAAGELAAAAGVGSLLLSHFYRVVDPEHAVASAGERYRGPVWAARDLDVFDLGTVE